jgi:hypothetical protein
LYDFHPDHIHGREVLEVFNYQSALGLQCLKLFTIVPKTLRSFLDEYTRIIRPVEAHNNAASPMKLQIPKCCTVHFLDITEQVDLKLKPWNGILVLFSKPRDG